MNTQFEADLSTEVLATSYFRNDAEFKTNMALIDSFSETDSARLAELLGSAYVQFTEAEITALSHVPAVIISREWFMDYDYALDADSAGMKQTEFYNPTTLENNHYLHAWRVFSTSPFENAVVFTSDTPAVTSVTVSPATATVSAGMDLKLSATVATTGFANKAVQWSVVEADGQQTGHPVVIDVDGVLHIPTDYVGSETVSDVTSYNDITVKATSLFNGTTNNTAVIRVVNAPSQE